MLLVTHTHEAGTLIEGTSKGDGSAEILKANGWRWGRSIASWYIPHSRDRLPKDHQIIRTINALAAAGFEVDVELDRTMRSMEEIEAGRAERQEARVDALDAKAYRKRTAADQARDRADAVHRQLPEGGEPIKIGHHSEHRHRRTIEKAHHAMGQAIAADKEADRAAERAETATHTTATRYRPVTVANRIEKLAADIRRINRDIVADRYDRETGYRPATEAEKQRAAERYADRLAELTEQHAYWVKIRDAQIVDGTATNYGPATVKKGDQVRIRGYWHEVIRANAKTVSVQNMHGWTDRTPWAEVQAHQTAAEPAAE